MCLRNVFQYHWLFVINLLCGWVSKNLPKGRGTGFTDPPELYWQVDHSVTVVAVMIVVTVVTIVIVVAKATVVREGEGHLFKCLHLINILT